MSFKQSSVSNKCKDQKPFQTVLLLSGFFGLLMGGFTQPTWHHAVEAAQVVAGKVFYPSPTPFFYYELNAWTLLHQISALLLQLGLNEISISIGISALTSMISYQAIAGITYSFTKEKWLSIFFPFLAEYCRLYNYGAVYPVILNGCTASYGIFGLFLPLVAAALLFNQRFILGGLLLGVCPAIHISSGIVAVLVLGSVFLYSEQSARTRFIKGFSAGLLITLVSLVIQCAFISKPFLIKNVNRQDWFSFIKLWDSHRAAISFKDLSLWVNVVCIGLSAGDIVKAVISRRSPDKRLLTVLLFGLISVLAVIITRLPLNILPAPLIKMMPGRFLNFNIVFYPALLLYFLSNDSKLSQAFFYTVLGLLILTGRFYPDYVPAFLLFQLTTIFIYRRTWNRKFFDWLEAVSKPAKWLFFSALILISAKILFLRLPRFNDIYRDQFRNWSNDPFFSAASKHTGVLLLAPDLSAYQLVTRRPVLIDPGALDVISYFPELENSYEIILKDIYGIDLLHPTPGMQAVAIIPLDFVQPIFEKRALEEWKRLGKKFQFTQVLTSGWKLQLPAAETSAEYTLYDIPS